MNTDWFEGRSWSLFHADEEAHERCYWRRVGFVMFAAVAIAVILLPLLLGGCATPPQSSKSAYDGPPMFLADGKGNTIRLTQAPCPNVSGWLAMASAEMVFQGKAYKACWLLIGETVLVFDDNGDVTPIPAQAFKRETPI